MRSIFPLKKNEVEMAESKQTCIVKMLPGELYAVLREALEARCWEFSSLPYAEFKATRNKTNVVLYHSGKLVIQGAESQDFVDFILEPEVLKDLAFQQKQRQFVPHAGMDESGKGDFFGPLVVAAVYLDRGMEQSLGDAGVRDCKLIKSDAQLKTIASDAMKIIGHRVGFVSIGPEAYNRMYSGFGSLNRLLAWGHARALENLLDKVPECAEAIADKFGDEHLILNALKEKGAKIHLIQRTKAESDMAVAAASVIARAGFLRRLEDLGKLAGIPLPKGAGEQVDLRAAELARKGGAELLSRFAKMHFRNSYKALGLPPPPKKEFTVHHASGQSGRNP